jgi:hypothetical protein
MGGLSRRVPEGQRAVSIAALVPTGIARGERVRVETGEERFEGTVVSARSTPDGGGNASASVVTDGGTAPAVVPAAPSAPTTAGGDGRVTIALPRRRATELLSHDRGRVVVLSRGTRREFELLSLFRRSGKRIAKITLRPGGPLDCTTIGEAAIRDQYGVAVLAVRGSHGDGSRRTWTFSPDGATPLAAGDEVFVVGTRDAVESVRGEVA